MAIFVNTNNTVYVAPRDLYRVLVWFEGSISPITVNFNGLSAPQSLFVTITGDIYVDNGDNGRIDKSTLNATQSTKVMDVIEPCYGLFVDINNTLYCSLFNKHQVIKTSLNSATDPSTIVAGAGSSGSLPNTLNGPKGIFVYINFDLYVVDSLNDRIQLFKSGELNATTLAVVGATETITLNRPSGVVLDADKYIFIADSGNNRIIRSGANGFLCLVGCSRTYGSESDQMKEPTTIRFDSYGNMFVTDLSNHRIQKFILSMNCSSKCLNK
jgi:hypothetical protein